MAMNRFYFFDQALLPRGWAEAVRLEIDENGRIVRVEHNAHP